MDGRVRVGALEYIASAYQYVYASLDQSRCRFCLYASIYLNEGMAAALLDELTKSAHLLDGVLDKLLTAKARIHAHQQHHVYVANDVFQNTYRGGRIEGDACFHACGVNLLNGTMQVDACLVMYIHHHRAYLGSLLNVPFWSLYHKVDVEWFGARLAYSFEYRETKRDVGYEHAVHYIHVKPVSFAVIYHFYIAPQVNEVG